VLKINTPVPFDSGLGISTSIQKVKVSLTQPNLLSFVQNENYIAAMGSCFI